MLQVTSRFAVRNHWVVSLMTVMAMIPMKTTWCCRQMMTLHKNYLLNRLIDVRTKSQRQNVPVMLLCESKMIKPHTAIQHMQTHTRYYIHCYDDTIRHILHVDILQPTIWRHTYVMTSSFTLIPCCIIFHSHFSIYFDKSIKFSLLLLLFITFLTSLISTQSFALFNDFIRFDICSIPPFLLCVDTALFSPIMTSLYTSKAMWLCNVYLFETALLFSGIKPTLSFISLRYNVFTIKQLHRLVLYHQESSCYQSCYFVGCHKGYILNYSRTIKILDSTGV